jgi:hypothetical protein
MRRLLLIYIKLAAVITCLVCVSSCKKNFGEINTNPNSVTVPDVKFLFSYSEDRLATYQGTEWIWESMEQLWRFTQHITSDPYEISNNVNSRYNAFYQSILPNLFEIRRQIDMKADKDAFQKMAAVTYVVQVMQGIKVTDMNGSIPYNEALKGRYDGNYSPLFDNQETLFNTWLKELDGAIAVLANNSLPAQQSFGTNDIYYKGDWEKWVMLANTLKLRIAARLENQNQAKTAEIFQQVMSNSIGPISVDNAQLSYSSVDYFGPADIDYRSPRYATTSIISFLKAANDPRLPVYFDKNDLQGDFKTVLAQNGATLPSFININDPLIMYQGGPADWTVNPTFAAYIKNPFQVGSTTTRYFLISRINRKFFAPRFGGNTTGVFTDVMVSNAESCLLVAEFIQKGYAGSVNTKGTAEDWYKKGITSSIKTMNSIAVAAASTPAYSTGDGTPEINAYLGNAKVMFNGAGNLEKIYIQQYLNLFRNPTEAFVFCRRTGYPKNNSTYYPREVFNEVIPRRFWTNDPGEVNRANWQKALQEQGFTPLAQDVPTLNSQRIWYDKNAPVFGGGL